MGAYAEAVWASLPGANDEPDLPRDVDWVVLTAGDPSPREVRALLPGPRRLLVVTGPGGRARGDAGMGDVTYARFEVGPPPRLSPEARAAVRGCGAAVLLDGIEGTSGRILGELLRAGVSRVAWRAPHGWVVASTRAAVLRKPVARLEKLVAASRAGRWYRRQVTRARAHQALKRRNAQAFHGQGVWTAHMARVGVVRRRREGPQLTVLLYIGQLNSGGAERQCVNLAMGLARLGHRVRVLTTYPLAEENAHYCDLLRQAGIRFGVAGARLAPGVLDKLRALQLERELVGTLPEVIRNPVLDLAGELLAEPPHVLHCWLDYPNVIGAAAGALVGTPHVVLSTRNVNPTYFPAFYQSWMDPWYALLVELPQVHLLANSTQGAADYARWIDLPVDRFEVVYNGVDLASMTDPPPADVAAVRDELSLRPGQPLVVGVFRLAQEKQPHLWVDVIERVARRVPDLRAAIVGIGDLLPEIEKRIAAKGLSRTISLMGQRKDVAAILAAADVKLLTSKVEGTPNVILEAQWAGCPPVATCAGGTPDAMVHDATGYLHDLHDVEGLAASVLRLLGDPLLRAEMGRAGRAFVRERFSLAHMVDAHVSYYDSLLGPVPPEVAEVATRNGVPSGPALAEESQGADGSRGMAAHRALDDDRAAGAAGAAGPAGAARVGAARAAGAAGAGTTGAAGAAGTAGA